jgi:hypothetical protein
MVRKANNVALILKIKGMSNGRHDSDTCGFTLHSITLYFQIITHVNVSMWYLCQCYKVTIET